MKHIMINNHYVLLRNTKDITINNRYALLRNTKGAIFWHLDGFGNI
jgi:hypothetical protein